MVAYDPLEIVATPEVTYIRSDHLPESRRIYTDGRDWPQKITPTFAGYSIGRWIGRDADGRYQALEVETRAMRGPHALDVDGLPLHRDNQTVVKENLFLDQANRNLLHDQITTIDHAYTRPWTVMRDYRRYADPNAESEGMRPPIPNESDHLIRTKAATLHPDSALVDRVDLATPLSPSSRLTLVSRLMLPRSGLERSDFVRWHFSDLILAHRV